MNVGAVQILVQSGFAYIVGGLIFDIALFRANVLALWAAVLLSVGAVATVATAQLPELTQMAVRHPSRRRPRRPRLLAVAHHPDGAPRCNHRR